LLVVWDWLSQCGLEGRGVRLEEREEGGGGEMGKGRMVKRTARMMMGNWKKGVIFLCPKWPYATSETYRVDTAYDDVNIMVGTWFVISIGPKVNISIFT
jgi:hypothetical protein